MGDSFSWRNIPNNLELFPMVLNRYTANELRKAPLRFTTNIRYSFLLMETP
jgi:hypothetical protein